MNASMEFRKGTQNLLRKACSIIRHELNSAFYRDESIPIYRDKYGYIAIPITDGIDTYYLVARSYIYNQRIVSIDGKLVRIAREKKINFLMFINDGHMWFVISPNDIIRVGCSTVRGHLEYIEFPIFEIGRDYQMHIPGLVRYGVPKTDTPDDALRCDEHNLVFASRKSYNSHLRIVHKKRKS